MALNGSDAQHRETAPIVFRNVTLRIPLRRKGTTSPKVDPLALLGRLYTPGKGRTEVRTIVDNASFEVHEGSRLALIGRNGAGKTTVLRLLAGSIAPTRGSIEIFGTVQALLNLSLGFRPEATGMENIYLRCLAMGMRLAEIKETIPDIIEFSELGDAIYDPIKTYSAGMRAKLAFSIATSRKPNVVIMDEWISAGDKYFVRKAQKRLRAQIDTCRALVLASHSSNIIKEICTHGLVMEAGRSLFLGKVDDALKFYDELNSSGDSNAKLTRGNTPAATEMAPSLAEAKETLAIQTSQGRVLVTLAPHLHAQRAARIRELVRQGKFDDAPLHRAAGSFVPATVMREGEVASTSQQQSTLSTGKELLICFEDGTLLDCHYEVLGRVIEGLETNDGTKDQKSSISARKFSSNPITS